MIPGKRVKKWGAVVGGERIYLDMLSKDLCEWLTIGVRGMIGEEPVVTPILKHWLIALGCTITMKE